MAAHVKSNTFGSRKAKDWEDGQSYGLDVDLGFFCGANFLGVMALDEIMPHMLRNHGSWATDDRNHVMVSNPSEMISIVIPMTKVNDHVPELQSGDERLNLQCDEI
jgi:hypothetical protein